MKTLGDLYDALKELDDAKDEIARAERAIHYGGNESTMRGKYRDLHDARDRLDALRERPLPNFFMPPCE